MRLKDSLITPGPIRTASIAAAFALIFYTIAGFLLLPQLIRSVLSATLTSRLNRQVTIHKVNVNPYALTVDINRFEMAEPQGPVAGIENLHLNLKAASLWRMAPVLSDLSIDGVLLQITRTGENRFNFSDLLPRPAEPEKADSPKPPAASPIQFSIDHLTVSKTKIEYIDAVAGGRHLIDPGDVTLHHLSSFAKDKDTNTGVAADITLNGGTFAIKGTAKPFDPSTAGDFVIEAKNFDLMRYVSYFPLNVDAKLASGTVEVNATVSIRKNDGGQLAIVVSGPVTLKNLALVRKNQEPLIHLPETVFVFKDTNLAAPDIHLERIASTKPEVTLQREPTGRLNLVEALSSGEADKEKAPGKPLPLKIDHVEIQNGHIRFSDRSTPAPFDTALFPIDLTFTGIETGSNGAIPFTLTAQTEVKETFNAKGTLFLQPVGIDGEFSVSDLQLPKYMPYLKYAVQFDVTGGRLTAGTRLRFQTGGDGPAVRVSNARLAISGVTVSDPITKEGRLTIGNFSGEAIEMDPSAKTLSLGQLKTDGIQLLLDRQPDGRLIFTTPAGSAREKDPPAIEKPAADPPLTPDTAAWAMTFGKILVGNGTVRVKDHTLKGKPVTAVTLETLDLENLTTEAGKTGSIAALKIKDEGSGRITASGDLQLTPFYSRLNIQTESIDLRRFETYFTDQVKFSLKSGWLHSEGKLTAGISQKGQFTAGYNGSLSLRNVGMTEKGSGQELLNWQSLYLSGIDYLSDPSRLTVDEVAFTDFYGRVIIDPEGSVNLRKAFAPSNPSGTGKAKQDAPRVSASGKKRVETSTTSGMPFSIKKITLQNGRVKFTDLLSKPNVEADLSAIGGHVSGIDSKADSRADVFLKGLWENHAPLEIKGTVNLLSAAQHLDLKGTVQEIDLKPFSPYSARYLGYPLNQGRLTLELTYQIIENHLNGQNRAFIQDLTLGDKVQSPDAIAIPVSLAISLLKDNQGNIDLDIPVEGDVNDPNFSLGKTILVVVKNTLFKLISAPFSWIGSLVGSSEKLNFISFDIGRSDILPAESKKLDDLAKALTLRPNLTLEIQGEANSDSDGEALSRKRMDQALKVQKQQELAKEGKGMVPLETVTISPEEYPIYLKKAYNAADFPKPRDADQKPKPLPLGEMEKLLSSGTHVGGKELTDLAMDRARQTRDYLMTKGALPAERLIIDPPAAGETQTGRNQVKFLLR